jgi:hypothetical protein
MFSASRSFGCETPTGAAGCLPVVVAGGLAMNNSTIAQLVGLAAMALRPTALSSGSRLCESRLGSQRSQDKGVPHRFVNLQGRTPSSIGFARLN